MNNCVVGDDGTKYHYLKGILHREDGPAIEGHDGTNRYYLNGELHREDGPAVVYNDGDSFWFRHNILHRVDGPAAEHTDGNHIWYLYDKHLEHPEEFATMEAFIEKLNENEEYSLQWISDINGLIELIKNPTGKQTRLNAMRWKI